jgi:hypothetical protein
MTTSDYPTGVTWAGPPRSYTTGRKTPVRLSVIHTTEGHAGADAAEVGPVIDKNRTDGTSTHCFHDNDSSTQEVLRKDTAHSAFFHGNTLGIQHENCGTATWTAAQWQGGYQQAMLRRCAAAVADDCRTYGLEPRRLSVAEVRRAYYGPSPYPKGICGHVDITAAFPEDGGTHWDPGTNFPWIQFISMVQESMDLGGDDDMRQYKFDATSYPDRPAGLGNSTVVTDGCGIYFERPDTFQSDAANLSGGMATVTVVKGSSSGTMPTGWSFAVAFASLTGGCVYDGPSGVADWRKPAAGPAPAPGEDLVADLVVSLSGTLSGRAVGAVGPAQPLDPTP